MEMVARSDPGRRDRARRGDPVGDVAGGTAVRPVNNARLGGGYECECGYLMVREGNERLRCANEACRHYGTLWRLPIWPLIEAKE